jgi:hypothetical protein
MHLENMKRKENQYLLTVWLALKKPQNFIEKIKDNYSPQQFFTLMRQA